MSLEFQVYLCLLLLTRLLYLRKDELASWRFVLALGAGQLALFVLFFAINGIWLVTAASVGLFTVVMGLQEPRIGLVSARLLSLAGLIVAPALASIWLGDLQLNAVGHWAGGMWVALGDKLAGNGLPDQQRFLAVVLALLVLANEVNIAMRGLFHVCGLEPMKKVGAGRHGHEESDVREFNAGRVIGILERWLMFLVVLFANDWAALGFIIAAKGLVRLKKLEDPIFAEYMLVGTLLSALFAVSVAWWVG